MSVIVSTSDKVASDRTNRSGDGDEETGAEGVEVEVCDMVALCWLVEGGTEDGG